MAKLKKTFENIAAGAISAGSVAGFRGSLFGGEALTRNLPAIDKVTLSPYAPKKKRKKTMKVKSFTVVSENHNMDAVTTSALRDLLRSKQKERELVDSTEVFALENEDGGIVKVYINRDQAPQFKSTIENMLADPDYQDKELAEILYALHQSFDIKSVDWGPNTIPEDEEEKVQNASDADERDYPDNETLGDVEADSQGTAADASADNDDIGDLEGIENVGDTNDGAASGEDQGALLTQIVQLLRSQADAARASAEADKAKADVEAAEAASKAAAQYAAHQEEVMDMENYVKRQREDRRENQIQAKLLRYRHDLRKDQNEDLEDKLKDPEFLLNTLRKVSIGESMTTNITPPTPEEEEVLAMEDWEKQQKEEKKNMQLRDRLMRFRHATGKQAATEQQEPGVAAVDGVASAEEEQVEQAHEERPFDPRTGSLMDYLLRAKKAGEVANIHNAGQQ